MEKNGSNKSVQGRCEGCNGGCPDCSSREPEKIEHITINLPIDLQRALIEDSKRHGKDLREQLPIAILYGLRLYAAAYISDFKRSDAP
jgi:hypothetical protein